jgi:hypothetical protein
MWTEELVEEFKKLYDKGLAHSAIATRLGRGLTRNSCIGKANRLGLPPRSKDSVALRLQGKRAANKWKASKPRPEAPPPIKPEATVDIRTLIAIPTNNFMAQRRGYCKWPHGDVCAHRITRHSYCDHHHRQSRRAE